MHTIAAPFSIIQSKDEKFINYIKEGIENKEYNDFGTDFVNPQLQIQYSKNTLIFKIHTTIYKLTSINAKQAAEYTVNLINTLVQYPFLIDVLRYGDKRQNNKHIIKKVPNIQHPIYKRYYCYQHGENVIIDLVNFMPDKLLYTFDPNAFEFESLRSINSIDLPPINTHIRAFIYPKHTYFVFTSLVKRKKQYKYSELSIIKFKFNNDVESVDLTNIIAHIINKYYIKYRAIHTYETYYSAFGYHYKELMQLAYSLIDPSKSPNTDEPHMQNDIKTLSLLNNKSIGNISTAIDDLDSCFKMVKVNLKL